MSISANIHHRFEALILSNMELDVVVASDVSCVVDCITVNLRLRGPSREIGSHNFQFCSFLEASQCTVLLRFNNWPIFTSAGRKQEVKEELQMV